MTLARAMNDVVAVRLFADMAEPGARRDLWRRLGCRMVFGPGVGSPGGCGSDFAWSVLRRSRPAAEKVTVH